MLILLFFLVVFNRIIYKSNLNPIFLQSALWFIYYALLSLNISSYDIHLYQVTNFVLLQSIGFSLGGFVCYLFTKKDSLVNSIPISDKDFDIPQKNLKILLPYFICIQVVFLILYYKLTGSASIFAIAEIRDTLAEDDGKNFGFFGLIQLVMSVYLLACTLSKVSFTIWYKVLVVLFLYFTMMQGSRGQFVYYFIALFYILLWQNRISGKKMLAFISTILGLMFLITIIRSQKASEQTLVDTLMIYTITSMPALHLATFANSKCFGYYTFRVIYVWLNKLGYQIPLSNILSEYTMTPLPTNVYSYIKPYYMDFGYLGVFILPLFLGFCHQYFYFKARRGSFVFLFLSSVLMFPLLMQVFEENYFRQLSNIAYSLILVFLVSKVSWKKVGTSDFIQTSLS